MLPLHIIHKCYFGTDESEQDFIARAVKHLNQFGFVLYGFHKVTDEYDKGRKSYSATPTLEVIASANGNCVTLVPEREILQPAGLSIVLGNDPREYGKKSIILECRPIAGGISFTLSNAVRETQSVTYNLEYGVNTTKGIGH